VAVELDNPAVDLDYKALPVVVDIAVYPVAAAADKFAVSEHLRPDMAHQTRIVVAMASAAAVVWMILFLLMDGMRQYAALPHTAWSQHNHKKYISPI
jgi:hypothetical protein